MSDFETSKPSLDDKPDLHKPPEERNAKSGEEKIQEEAKDPDRAKKMEFQKQQIRIVFQKAAEQSEQGLEEDAADTLGVIFQNLDSVDPEVMKDEEIEKMIQIAVETNSIRGSLWLENELKELAATLNVKKNIG